MAFPPQIQFICIVSYGEFGEEEKALNLVELVADKLIARIGIYELDVGGPTLLIIFGGLDFQIRASTHCGGPLFILTVAMHFLGLVLHFGM